MKRFCCTFDVSDRTTILDIGGGHFNWELIDQHPNVTMLNLKAQEASTQRPTRWVIGDARALPFRDGAFDIAYSNSVIEHLGGIHSQLAFAAEVARVGRRFYVQTPNRRFPVEAHYLTPFLHYLPKSVQIRLVRNFTVWGIMLRPSKEQVRELVQELRLLGRPELVQLFPTANIISERVLWLHKSFIAIKA